MDYKQAGVDIKAGNHLVETIKPLVKKTFNPQVLAGLGGFAALYELPIQDYQQPILVSGTDGVGTKLKLAMQTQQHDTIGIDLVAMCANDIVVQGAKPLFFLDYYATGQLDVNMATDVIRGMTTGCELANMALIGGETAEMPGMYQGNDYDLAGFCVGIVEKSQLITGEQVKAGDQLIAIASSGPHSNGYSLIRKILAQSSKATDTAFTQQLLTPTRIYVRSLLALFEQVNVHALAHITGGGLLENLPRVLPPTTQAVIQRNRWQYPEIFQWLQQQAKLNQTQMLTTFNCGVGMVVCVDANDVDTTIECLQAQGEQVWHFGHIETSAQTTPTVKLV